MGLRPFMFGGCLPFQPHLLLLGITGSVCFVGNSCHKLYFLTSTQLFLCLWLSPLLFLLELGPCPLAQSPLLLHWPWGTPTVQEGPPPRLPRVLFSPLGPLTFCPQTHFSTLDYHSGRQLTASSLQTLPPVITMGFFCKVWKPTDLQLPLWSISI